MIDLTGGNWYPAMIGKKAVTIETSSIKQFFFSKGNTLRLKTLMYNRLK